MSKELRKEIEAETRAFLDQMERVARDDADWGFYLDPAERPRLPWWKRFLGIPPSDKEVEEARERARRQRAEEASGGN